MFEQLAGSLALRAAATVLTTTNVDFRSFDTRSGSIMAIVVLAGRSTGTLQSKLLASFDSGSTYPTTLKDSGAVSTNRYVYLQYTGPLPDYLRVQLIPASSWDGTAAVILRAAGLVSDE